MGIKNAARIQNIAKRLAPTRWFWNVGTAQQSSQQNTHFNQTEHDFHVKIRYHFVCLHSFVVVCVCARARLAFVALHSLNFFCLFVFIQFIICFCCRILFGSMTAPPCVLSSTLFVHMHRCVALRSCCFLLLFWFVGARNMKQSQ